MPLLPFQPLFRIGNAKVAKFFETAKEFLRFNITLTLRAIGGVQFSETPLFRHTSSRLRRERNAAVCNEAPANAVPVEVLVRWTGDGQNRKKRLERLCLVRDGRELGSS